MVGRFLFISGRLSEWECKVKGAGKGKGGKR